MLTFDEARHQYFWSGVPVPNVTRIIGHLSDYSRIPAEVLERARQEGVAIHKMAELHFTGALDLAALYGDPAQAWLIPHYEALLKFCDDTGFECFAAEKRIYHPGLRYAGTPDLIGVTPKLQDVKGASNWDIKRSFYGGAAIGLQTAAYTRAWNDTEAKADKSLRIPDSNRFALQLRRDGTYRFEQFRDPDDAVAFLACLTQLNWKEKHHGSP